MKEVHADAQFILDAVTTHVADDQLVGYLVKVIGEKQGQLVLTQPGDSKLAG
jgi:hypothetical protein